MSIMTTKEYVLNILENYHETERYIAILRYELENHPHITEEEMIDTLAYHHGEHEGGTSGGNVSDNTPYTAMNYEEKTENANAEICTEIMKQLEELEMRQKRLLFYISQLEETNAKIIRMSYVDKKSLEEIAEEVSLTSRTVWERRKKAIDKLCEIYERTAFLQHR